MGTEVPVPPAHTHTPASLPASQGLLARGEAPVLPDLKALPAGPPALWCVRSTCFPSGARNLGTCWPGGAHVPSAPIKTWAQSPRGAPKRSPRACGRTWLWAARSGERVAALRGGQAWGSLLPIPPAPPVLFACDWARCSHTAAVNLGCEDNCTTPLSPHSKYANVRVVLLNTPWQPRTLYSIWHLINDVLGFPRGSDSKESAPSAGDPGSVPELGRAPGEGNGNPLQYPCLENPMDRAAWRAPWGKATSVGSLKRVGHDWATKYFHFFKWFTTYFLKQKWPQKPRAKSVPRKFAKELRNIGYQLHSNDPNKECAYFWKRKNKKWFRKFSSVKVSQNVFLMKMNILYLWWGWRSLGPGPVPPASQAVSSFPVPSLTHHICTLLANWIRQNGTRYWAQ